MRTKIIKKIIRPVKNNPHVGINMLINTNVRQADITNEMKNRIINDDISALNPSFRDIKTPAFLGRPNLSFKTAGPTQYHIKVNMIPIKIVTTRYIFAIQTVSNITTPL